MLGHLSVVQVAFHPACVQPDQQATQLVAQVHEIVSPSVRIGQAAACGPVVAAGGPCPLEVPRGEAYPRYRRGPANGCGTKGSGRGPTRPRRTKENGPVRGGETDRPEGGLPP
ncbi:hypothetical protein GCM10010383_17430 [Streptomyces lomondensis]|uniref:Uncharacterized protein n=1 Tax=Streptomyces lomondensis TaxID=68229 RepID=A0ABQ2X056_9ACTN|nr:hypothetical protein GCM10010383_17430 [Streptomyces lomondensis]